MNFIKYGRTDNLFDYSTITFGKYINASGEEVASSGTYEQSLNHSDYITVDAGMTYTFKCDKSTIKSATTNAFCWFDSSKQLISRDLFNADAVTSFILGTATAPINAVYLIMNYRGLHGDTAMLNTGSTALPYQPYKDWTDTPHYIHNTSTDTITTLPADIYANAVTATVGLKGNTVQNGTPSPQNPVDVNGVGVRTENLFDYSDLENGSINTTDGSNMDNPAQKRTKSYMSVIGGESYCISNLPPEGSVRVHQYKQDKTYLGSNLYNSVFTTDATCAYVRISGGSGNFNPNVMLNVGSTAKPFEPYGNKIPILNNSTTTPVYLGEVQSTRKIKKLVLTGEEDWALSTSYNGGFYLATINPDYMRDENSNLAISTHYITDNQTASVGNVNQGHMSFSYTSAQRLYIRDTNYATADAFKTYLQQQYSAGTPVTVWYVLATPTTGIVNEPLMKIGDYADSVSGITIPTIAGANTLSIGTTLQPSEVMVNYKGWHPVQSAHERESGQWD